MNRLDSWLIDKFDAALAYLQEVYGITLPAVLQQIYTDLLIFSSLICICGILNTSNGWLWAFYGIGLMLLTPPYLHNLRIYAKDATREWTSSLADVYRRRALARRQQRPLFRMFNLYFPSIILALDLSHLYFVSDPIRLLDVLFWVWFLLMSLRDYTACAFPRDPNSRARSLNLAPGLT